MLTPETLVRRPIILTEKSNRLRERNQVIFEVAPDANKIQIKDAIQKLFKVTVVDVNTMNYRGKERRMGRGYGKLQNWKKAIITLKEGDQIQFFDSEG
jgi:large subunit ribosomal protein L23